MSHVIQAEIPEQLSEQVEVLVRQGWANNLQDVVNEALRRYLDSHQAVLTEAFIREDVDWGLHGDD